MKNRFEVIKSIIENSSNDTDEHCIDKFFQLNPDFPFYNNYIRASELGWDFKLKQRCINRMKSIFNLSDNPKKDFGIDNNTIVNRDRFMYAFTKITGLPYFNKFNIKE